MTPNTLTPSRKLLQSLMNLLGMQSDETLRLQIDTARRREAELVGSLAIVTEQQRVLAEQHRAAVAQHASAVAQYQGLTVQNAAAVSQYEALAVQHAATVSQYEALAVQHAKAISQCEVLAVQHATAISQYEALAVQRSDAVAQHADAVAQYDALAAQLASMEDQLRGGPLQDPELGPSIVLSSLPKSGSIYQLSLFEKGLGYAARNTSLGYFPRDLADWSKLGEVMRGGAMTQFHLDASPANLQILRVVCPRLQVHFRDPRQATLSMTHHLRRLWDMHHDLRFMLPVQPVPDRRFFECDIATQIDWMIDHYLPGCVQWIEEWLTVADDPAAGIEVLLTTFEEMIRDEPAFVARTLDFFRIPAGRFANPNLERTMAVHYRQGTPDEWRGIFTEAQRVRATAAIPFAWKTRFGWLD